MNKNEIEKDIIRAHVCSSSNKEQLKKVRKCGGFFCFKIFDPKLIKDWCDNGETAICPFCDIDNKFYSVENHF